MLRHPLPGHVDLRGEYARGGNSPKMHSAHFYSELEAMVHKYFDDLPIKMVFFFHSALAQISRGQISFPSNVPITTHQMPP